MQNIINNNDDFNERTNTLLYKNISLTFYSRKGWCWLCVMGELRQGRTVILPRSSSDHSSTSFSSWLGVAPPWVTEGLGTLSLQADSYVGILSPTDSGCLALVISSFNAHLLPLFFRLFTQVHFLIDGSVEGQYVIVLSVWSSL